jgi:ribosome-associated protein YbcJ (S4-like RNA binding protein)
MQTNFGCCLVDGEVVKSKSEKLKIKNKNPDSVKKNRKPKKVIHQNEVEFE